MASAMLRSMVLVLVAALTARAAEDPETHCAAASDADASHMATTRRGPGAGGRDSVLLQLRRAGAGAGEAAAEPEAVESGDTIFLKVRRTGHRITIQQNGEVHAKWSNRGEWEQLTIERVAGPGAVQSGDLVILRGVWGKPLTVQGRAAHARWDHEGSWQKLLIETKEGGAIRAASVIFLKAHTGVLIDADAPRSPGVVQARWNRMGGWQALIVEPKTPPPTATTTTTTTPESTSVASTTSSAPAAEVSKVSAQAWEHFELLNDLRAAGHTCPKNKTTPPNPVPLKFDCRLWKAAQLHSQDMADNNYFSHFSQDRTSPWVRARRQNTSSSAENIAAGYATAEKTLRQFQRSNGHCMGMLNPRQLVIGVGYGYNASAQWRHRWTQMFGAWTEDVETWCYPDGAALAQSGPAEEQHETDPPVEIGEAWTMLK